MQFNVELNLQNFRLNLLLISVNVYFITLKRENALFKKYYQKLIYRINGNRSKKHGWHSSTDWNFGTEKLIGLIIYKTKAFEITFN